MGFTRLGQKLRFLRDSVLRKFWLGFNHFYHITECYRISIGLSVFYRVSLGFIGIGFYLVLMGFIWFHWFLLGLTRFYWVLLDYTGFY